MTATPGSRAAWICSMLVGLNIYFDYDTSVLLAAARQLFPGQEEVAAETVNTYHPDCHPLALCWAKSEALGKPDGNELEPVPHRAPPRVG